MTDPPDTANTNQQTSERLLVTVENDTRFHTETRDALADVAGDESADRPDRLSIPDLSTLFDTLAPHTVELLERVRTEEPESIRETARLVGRDPKNVHEELTRLARVGVIRFDEDGTRKRPVVPYAEVVIDLPLDCGGRAGERAVSD